MAAHTIKTSRAQYQNVDDETSPLGGGGLGGHLAGGCRATKRVCSRPALVATIYGATGGVLGATVSLTVNNALFEISVVPYFAIVIGLVLMMLGGTMAQVHPAPGPALPRTPTLSLNVTLTLTSGRWKRRMRLCRRG